ncbi:MAG: hypothetical protein R3D05_06680 [Dongiaceae bacterium]
MLLISFERSTVPMKRRSVSMTGSELRSSVSMLASASRLVVGGGLTHGCHYPD